MSKAKTIKTFRDLLAFLTIIPVGKTDDFIVTSAESIFLFPLIGGLIGLLGAAYFYGCSLIVSLLVTFFNSFLPVSIELLSRFAPALMTQAFLLVLTGLQHFDGLVDLGNALGFHNLRDRRKVAHAWTVTKKGALLAIFIESLAVFGLFLLNLDFAIIAIIASEVGAKLSMVTITWIGKPSHTGLGSIFLETAKKKLNVIAYLISFLILIPLLGLIGVLIILVSIFFGVFMERVANRVFAGVSGDMIGATNEIVRASILVLLAGVMIL